MRTMVREMTGTMADTMNDFMLSSGILSILVNRVFEGFQLQLNCFGQGEVNA